MRFHGMQIIMMALVLPQTALAGQSVSPSPSSTPVAAATPFVETLGYPRVVNQLPIPMVTVGRVTDGIRLSLTPSVSTAHFGDVADVYLWVNNATGRSINVCYSTLRISLHFAVRDDKGTLLQQLDPPLRLADAFPRHCLLPTYMQWRYVIPINQFVQIPKAGTYSVQATLHGDTNYPRVHYVTLQSNTITLNETP